MASSLTHLAAARRILDQIEIRDPERFRLGEILPDAAVDKFVSFDSLHYKKTDPETRIRIFDLARFREEFTDHLQDSLYLGYYCHLIQDAIFRWFCFAYKHLQTLVPAWDGETIQKLYHDYSLLNHPLIERYAITVPEAMDLTDEPIVNIAPLDVPAFLDGIHAYYDEPAPEPPEPYLFSWTDVEEYLDMVCEACVTEIRNIQNGAGLLSGHEWEYHH